MQDNDEIKISCDNLKTQVQILRIHLVIRHHTNLQYARKVDEREEVSLADDRIINK